MMKMMKKALPVVLVLTVGLAGCYGPFNLTKKLYRWNGSIGDKWVNEGVFLGLVIMPVYCVAALGDAIIFNSLEFWGEKNPVQARATKSLQAGDEQAVLSYTPEDKRLRIDSFRDGRLQGTVILEPGAQGMVARDARGEIILKAKTLDDGHIVISDPHGRRLGTYDPARLPETLARMD
ncbi:MAG: DUF3332 family protein [Elusimicrobia bacterium]|nr:DUF3332 family protein [Elusimicrobiota bacterium]